MTDPISSNAPHCPPPNYDLDANMRAADLNRHAELGMNDPLTPMPYDPGAWGFLKDEAVNLMSVGMNPGSAALHGLRHLKKVVEFEFQQADAINEAYHRSRAEGAIAGIAGYEKSPEITARRKTEMGFNDGMVAAEKIGEHLSAEEAEQLVNYIQMNAKDGEGAVLNGQDHGADFQERYEADAAFRAGVDHMRYLKEADPEAFSEAAERYEADVAALDCARIAQLPL